MARPELQIAPPERDRYTLDGDAAVEARIARDQAVIAEAVLAELSAPEFRALVLMGGYGRGEGGYAMRDGQPAPYNDYDYFVVVSGCSRARRGVLSRRLADVARQLEHRVGVEVDFALLREEGLPYAEYSLMNAEMLWGHRIVAGDPEVLRAMPAMPFDGLPAGEFTRLLLNRGALLLMNQLQLRDGTGASADREVFFKYLFKAVLACGDAMLACQRAYHPSYVRKLELLRSESAGSAAFPALYEQAWEQKFHPDYNRYAGEDVAAWQQRVVRIWLETLSHFEQWRTARPVDSWESYASPQLLKGQGGIRSWFGLRNALVTLRDFGPGELLLRPRWSLRYPRERLISALPLLLVHPAEDTGPAVAAALAVPPDTPWAQAADTFLRLWRRYA